MLQPFFMSLLLAVISAYVMYPLVNGLRRFFRSYHVGLIIALLMIAVPISMIIMYSVNDLSTFTFEVTGFGEEINKLLSVIEEHLAEYGLSKFAVNTQDAVSEMTEYLKKQLTSFVFTIPMIMLHLVIYLIATYYFLKDGSGAIKFFNRYVDTLEYRENRMIGSIMTGLKNSFDVLFLSYITISIIVTIFAWTGFYLLEIPFSGVLAILSGIFSFLPLLGIWIVYVAIAIYELSIGNMMTAILVVGFGVVFLNIIPDFIIRPIIGSKTGKVHPMTILLGFFGGPLVFGASGFLIGPILLVIVETVVVSYMRFNINLMKNNKIKKKKY